jgi:hypothetical protein
MFIPNVKQSKAAGKLHRAWLYLASTRKTTDPRYEMAFDILMECERFVHCGYRMNAQEHFHLKGE